ncbi:hypothetical protein [Enhygromyxa salina]|uniref:hypothetical protein n=1 Tax=Enhygromyxa salina TaxID=215803 RepID=UPI0011B1DA9B|nr:hypothetical protein [Enhygromyxa salina]
MTLADLATGLTGRGEQFSELKVFADDVEEIVALGRGDTPEQLRPLDREGKRFAFTHDNRPFEVELSGSGVVRVYQSSRPDPDVMLTATAVGAMAGAAVGAASSRKGQNWLGGLVVGMLAGAVFGAGATVSPPRRVLTMAFDAGTGRWQIYDGGLVRWMKEEFRSSAPQPSA